MSRHLRFTAASGHQDQKEDRCGCRNQNEDENPVHSCGCIVLCDCAGCVGWGIDGVRIKRCCLIGSVVCRSISANGTANCICCIADSISRIGDKLSRGITDIPDDLTDFVACLGNGITDSIGGIRHRICGTGIPGSALRSSVTGHAVIGTEHRCIDTVFGHCGKDRQRQEDKRQKQTENVFCGTCVSVHGSHTCWYHSTMICPADIRGIGGL